MVGGRDPAAQLPILGVRSAGLETAMPAIAPAEVRVRHAVTRQRGSAGSARPGCSKLPQTAGTKRRAHNDVRRVAPVNHKIPDNQRLDAIVAQARRDRQARQQGYRERALKMYPWICGRCAREFTRANLPELTVHHRNHNHDDNPADGSNWELLCLYCHDNEHQRQVEAGNSMGAPDAAAPATSSPFAGLAGLLKKA